MITNTLITISYSSNLLHTHIILALPLGDIEKSSKDKRKKYSSKNIKNPLIILRHEE